MIIATAFHFLSDLISYLPPGLVPSFAAAFIENGKYLSSFLHEFVGTLIMICCTFSAGKWIGRDSVRIGWGSHAMGVIAADFIGGGPHVNPAVTMSMWTLGKVTYTDAFVRVAGQLSGGLIAFPLFHAISDALKLEPFGGPEFNMADNTVPAEAFMSEFFATMLLLFAIYILNWELNFGSFHYIIKQSLTAVAIRVLIETFPTAGPAMNPMLATAWDVFGVGTTYEFPSDFKHYFVYWIAPFLAAVLASFIYAVYDGTPFFGVTLPIGPLKPKKTEAKAEKKQDAKKKN